MVRPQGAGFAEEPDGEPRDRAAPRGSYDAQPSCALEP
jgi:hypothetical protein